MCGKFQVCIVFRLARGRDTHKHINTYIHTYTNIRVNLRISSTGCSPHVDFENVYNMETAKYEVSRRIRFVTIFSFLEKPPLHVFPAKKKCQRLKISYFPNFGALIPNPTIFF